MTVELTTNHRPPWLAANPSPGAISTGAAAGCRTVLIDRGYRERMPDHAPDFRAASLEEAVAWILGRGAG